MKTAEFRLADILSGDARDSNVVVPRRTQFIDAEADGRDLVLYAIVSDSEPLNRRVILCPVGAGIPAGGMSCLKTISTDCGPMFVFLENPIVHLPEFQWPKHEAGQDNDA